MLGRIRPASCAVFDFGAGVLVADGRTPALVDLTTALGDAAPAPATDPDAPEAGCSPGGLRPARLRHARPGTAQDNRRPPQHGRRPGADITGIEGAHMVMISQPDAVPDVIMTALKAVN